MIQYWGLILAALSYLCVLCGIVYWSGYDKGRIVGSRYSSSFIYALTCTIYLSAWSYYGLAEQISVKELDLLALLAAPLLIILFGNKQIRKVAWLVRRQNSTSVADFIACRYSKSAGVSAIVTLVCILAIIPYIALQVKAVSYSFWFLSGSDNSLFAPEDMALTGALLIGLFTVALAALYLNTDKQKNGISYAIAFTALLKLFCFICAGFFAWSLLPAMPEQISEGQLSSLSDFKGWFSGDGGPAIPVIMIFLGAAGFLLLPRQFHILFIQNRRQQGRTYIRFLFPLYIGLFCISAFSLAEALRLLPPQSVNPDFAILALPSGSASFFREEIAFLIFIGGFAAASIMVAMEAIASAIMVSNHLFMPALLHYRQKNPIEQEKLGNIILVIRYFSIIILIVSGYFYYRLIPDQSLTGMGLFSFALIAQLVPALAGSFLWKRGTAFGAIGGLLAGLCVWFLTPVASWFFAQTLSGYFLTLPYITNDLPVFSIVMLLSLFVNSAFYILFSMITRSELDSYLTAHSLNGRQPLYYGRLTVDDLKFAVARYYGAGKAEECFTRYYQSKNRVYEGEEKADPELITYIENLLTSFTGASSARLTLTLLARSGTLPDQAARQLLDETIAVIQHNRNVFQRAMDNSRQGVFVLDSALNVSAWNKAFQDIYELPNDQMVLGTPLETILHYLISQGRYGTGDAEKQVYDRIKGYSAQYRFVRQKLEPGGRTIEVRSSRLPDGGVVSTHTDITDLIIAEEERVRAQELLEQRVRERTEELTRLNEELREAKAEADAANQSKTRFLAAASHDILQPLNAARLYSASIVERDRRNGDVALAENISSSLDAVEDILTTLLDMSRLDSGGLKPDFSSYCLGDMTRILEKEFKPLAREKGLEIRFVHSSLSVRTDRRQLRRLIQNLISNAVKYTQSGRILVGIRRKAALVRLEVWDTGIGIPETKMKTIFEEFKRLDEGVKVAKGLGLGLSIVERIARLLHHELSVDSKPGRGSVFRLTMLRTKGTASSQKSKPGIPVTIGALSGLTVFVVDNEPSILEGMHILLSGWGCETITATGLNESVAALDQNNQPDIIIADYHLDNGENGLQVIDSIREQLNSSIPAALLTADRSPEMQAEAAAIGALVLNKPLKPAALRALLSRIRSGIVQN